MQRVNRSGEITYHHQFYGASLVHPNVKAVIPFAPEPIQVQDGSGKNDCERNASKRFLSKFRADHPKLKAIIVEDALAANAPHIREILKYNLLYIIGVKPDDHIFLFAQIAQLQKQGLVSEHSEQRGDISHIFRYCNDLPLNQSNQDVRVNFLEYWEINHKTNKEQHFTWITGIRLVKKNTYQVMRGGRARWKIENETFNTLKNQGYHFEHNYGHGHQNLSFNLATLMMLAFLVDQVLQLTCKVFKGADQKAGSKTKLWEQIRKLFFAFQFDSMLQIYQALYYGFELAKPKIFDSS